MGFFKDLFFLDLGDYEYIGIRFPLGIFLIAMTAVISIALFWYNGKKIYLTLTVKRLLRFGATSESNAKTLKALSLDKNRFLKHELKVSRELNFTVKAVYESEEKSEDNANGKTDGRLDFDKARFYIPEERLDGAKRIAETDASWWKPAVLTAVMIAVLILFGIFADDILSALNGYLKP